MFAHFRSLAAAPAYVLVFISAVAVAKDVPPQLTGGHGNAQFLRLWDENGDGKVARAEYDASGAKAFEHLGDGEVTREQFDAQRAASFAATDVNRDGKLDQDEYLKEFVARLEQQIQWRRQDQLKQGGVRFKSIDENNNGAISNAEYLLMSARMFERTDTNDDGVVSTDDPAAKR